MRNSLQRGVEILVAWFLCWKHLRFSLILTLCSIRKHFFRHDHAKLNQAIIKVTSQYHPCAFSETLVILLTCGMKNNARLGRRCWFRKVLRSGSPFGHNRAIQCHRFQFYWISHLWACPTPTTSCICFSDSPAMVWATRLSYHHKKKGRRSTRGAVGVHPSAYPTAHADVNRK